MPEIAFYHLTRKSVEETLPTLLERSLARGWRVVVQAASAKRVKALDAHLWAYRPESFLPHGTKADAAPEIKFIPAGPGGAEFDRGMNRGLQFLLKRP